MDFSNIVISIMIKNEAPVVEKTLASYISQGFFKFMVMDTGSTDSTMDIIHKIQKHPGISLSIVEQDFIDFSTSRNQLLKYTYNIFSDCLYTLMIDSEWYLHMSDPNPLLSITSYDVIYVRIEGMNYKFKQPRLFRIGGNASFKGRIHETIYNDDPSVKIQTSPVKGFYLEWKPSHRGIHQSFRRMDRDVEILLQENDLHNGSDGRTLFYLAFTYECKNHHDKALEYYEKRMQLFDIDTDEYFLTCYYAGRLLLSRSMDLEKGIEYLEKAASVRPNRAEPLVWIGRYKNNVYEKYNYFRKACGLHFPKRGFLLEINLWRIERWKQLALCAPKVNKKKEGRLAFENIFHRLSLSEKHQLMNIYS